MMMLHTLFLIEHLNRTFDVIAWCQRPFGYIAISG